MKRSRPAVSLVAVSLVAVAALAACGGGDDDTSSDAGPGTGGVPGGPVATVPSSLPDAYRPAVGPVDVTGEALPPLGDASIDTDPARGRPAPKLLGLGFDSQPVRIDAAADGPTMVVFVAHWCPHCNAELPRLNELRDDDRVPEWLNVVAVATASEPQRPGFPPGSWLAEKDWTWPAMADGVDLDAGAWVAADAFGVDGFPFIALVDGEGNIAARWSGESTTDELAERIDDYLG